LKLLAKTAEERYQTAAGVEADLRRCLAEWEARRRIDAFTLGPHDISNRLLMPEKLYGRDQHIPPVLVEFPGKEDSAREDDRFVQLMD